MARDGVDLIVCLPWTHHHDRGQADARYLTQLGENSDEVTVAFPIEGDVAAWHTRGGAWPSSNWFPEGVFAAPRGTGGRTIVDWVKEHSRYERATVAIAGLDASFYAHARAQEGEVNWQSVEIIKRELPNAKIVSGTPILGEARWRKSVEEIEFLRTGVEIAEKTLQAIRAHARAGVAERHVFAEMLFANADAGGSFAPMFGWVSGPLGKTYHRVEQPSFRKFGTGDVLIVEIEGRWGGYTAEINQTFSIGPAHQDLRDGFKLSCAAFDRIFETLRPGVTVSELADAAHLSGMNGRGSTSLGALHGRGTGDDGPGFLGSPKDDGSIRGVVIEEGCSFALHAGTSVDGTAGYGGWGETVVVRSDGAERLGTRPQELYEL